MTLPSPRLVLPPEGLARDGGGLRSTPGDLVSSPQPHSTDSSGDLCPDAVKA